jgi:hypothetical protein
MSTRKTLYLFAGAVAVGSVLLALAGMQGPQGFGNYLAWSGLVVGASAVAIAILAARKG